MGIMDVLEELDFPEQETEETVEEQTQEVEAKEEAPEPLSMPELNGQPLPEEPEEEFFDEDMPPLEAVIAAAKKKPRLRPEWILGGIAVLCALLLIVVILICLPYMKPADEDPQI